MQIFTMGTKCYQPSKGKSNFPCPGLCKNVFSIQNEPYFYFLSVGPANALSDGPNDLMPS